MLENQVTESVTAVANGLSADIFLISGPLDRDVAAAFSQVFRKEARRENAALLLTTKGGDLEMAYRLARLIKRPYKRLTLYVMGDCLGAGSFFALAADNLVMADFGAFGPINATSFKEDEALTAAYGERLKGGDCTSTLNTLMHGYPSPNFVIDATEVGDLYGNTRDLNNTEFAMYSSLIATRNYVLSPSPEASYIGCLSDGANARMIKVTPRQNTQSAKPVAPQVAKSGA